MRLGKGRFSGAPHGNSAILTYRPLIEGSVIQCSGARRNSRGRMSADDASARGPENNRSHSARSCLFRGELLKMRENPSAAARRSPYPRHGALVFTLLAMLAPFVSACAPSALPHEFPEHSPASPELASLKPPPVDRVLIAELPLPDEDEGLFEGLLPEVDEEAHRMHHGHHQHHGHHGGHDHGSHDHGSHDHGSHDHSGHDHGSHNHGSHDHGSHDHGAAQPEEKK